MPAPSSADGVIVKSGDTLRDQFSSECVGLVQSEQAHAALRAKSSQRSPPMATTESNGNGWGGLIDDCLELCAAPSDPARVFEKPVKMKDHKHRHTAQNHMLWVKQWLPILGR